ncbi:hypothetical protein, partial [Streptomyces sp. NPDC059168]|uniref:hypothetical protein n=1 Tax=Streptomyces sp. NPDC059168 TaxID=3346753 RepID=UPI0036C36D54
MAAVAACAALTGGLLQAAPAAAAPKPSPDPGDNAHATPAVPGRVTDPDNKLGKGWRSSSDRAVTAAADAGGLKIMVADSRRAYEW